MSGIFSRRELVHAQLTACRWASGKDDCSPETPVPPGRNEPGRDELLSGRVRLPVLLNIAGREVSIRPYSEGDEWVLVRTLGAPSQMVHLNGPESLEKIRDRHRRYVAMSAYPQAGCMYTIMVDPSPAGNVGYWEGEWRGQKVWETGWFVLPEFQGQGVATEATRLLVDVVTKLHGHSSLVATPSVNNHPSNTIPRKLGFALAGEAELEYPPGSSKVLRCNVWRLTLPATPRQPNQAEARAVANPTGDLDRGRRDRTL